MESNEDSIKILEMRIRQQMNHSSKKNLKPENIQYYVSSSAMLHRQDLEQDLPSDAKIVLNPDINFKEEILQQKTHIEGEDLQQDVSGGEGETADQSGFENLPVDTEYIDRASEMAQMIEHIEISEAKEAQHVKARSGYERVRRSLDTEKTIDMKKSHLFDAKG